MLSADWHIRENQLQSQAVDEDEDHSEQLFQESFTNSIMISLFGTMVLWAFIISNRESQRFDNCLFPSDTSPFNTAPYIIGCLCTAPVLSGLVGFVDYIIHYKKTNILEKQSIFAGYLVGALMGTALLIIPSIWFHETFGE